jgi:hypothetical protein
MCINAARFSLRAVRPSQNIHIIKDEFFLENIDYSLSNREGREVKAKKRPKCFLIIACCSLLVAFCLLLPAAPLITDYSSLTLFAYCLLLPAFPLITDY